MPLGLAMHAHVASGQRGFQPSFLITIDTEGDNLWEDQSTEVATENARYLPRFQGLCESFRFRPTYLVDYEMACSPTFIEFGRDILARDCGEIGMHLHAWHSPPAYRLTADDFRCRPYLIEYPDKVLTEKVTFLTALLEETFAQKMVCHRAGRWAFNETYARALVGCGYRIDCSVTPRVSWKALKGAPDGEGGSDYRSFPANGYYLDLEDVSRPGDSALLELPMTIRSLQPSWMRRLDDGVDNPGLLARAVNRFFPTAAWLRPNGRNLGQMLRVVRAARAEGCSYVMFMLHSSEFMPGGSPYFPTRKSIEKLYADLERLFAVIAALGFKGRTLQEHHDAHAFSAGTPATACEESR